MLTLYLLRHAKAEPSSPHVDDLARPLASAGRAAARRLGDFLKGRNEGFDRALVSSSNRTVETGDVLAEALGPFARSIEPGLYNATPSALQRRIADIDDTTRRLALIGHNPGISELALTLAQGGDPQEIARMRKRFPPCSLAVFSFQADDWRDAMAGRGGQLAAFYLPDDIADAS